MVQQNGSLTPAWVIETAVAAAGHLDGCSACCDNVTAYMLWGECMTPAELLLCWGSLSQYLRILAHADVGHVCLLKLKCMTTSDTLAK